MPAPKKIGTELKVGLGASIICGAIPVDRLICMNDLVHSLPGSCSTFLVPAPKKIGTELKVVRVVLGAWPKTMVQNSTYHRDCHDITSGIRSYYTTRHTLDMCTLICHSLTMNP